MLRAIFPGSFDPITLGHLDVLARAASVFDEVTLLVMISHCKKPLFSADEREAIAREAAAGLPRVKVDSYGGLTTDYCAANGISAIVKGIRSVADFEYEREIAAVLRGQSGIETFLLPCSAGLEHVSSSTALHLFRLGADVGAYLPRASIDALRRRTELSKQ